MCTLTPQFVGQTSLLSTDLDRRRTVKTPFEVLFRFDQYKRTNTDPYLLEPRGNVS